MSTLLFILVLISPIDRPEPSKDYIGPRLPQARTVRSVAKYGDFNSAVDACAAWDKLRGNSAVYQVAIDNDGRPKFVFGECYSGGQIWRPLTAEAETKNK